MTLARRLGLSAFAGCLSFALSAAPAAAELATWDQTRVTGLAQQLAQACDAWEQAVREQPGAGAEASEFGLGMKARGLQEQSQALAGHLAKGEGHDETRNYYRSLKELIDDTEEMAQRSELDEPTMDAWAKVDDLQRQVAPYYDPKALEGAGAGQ